MKINWNDNYNEFAFAIKMSSSLASPTLKKFLKKFLKNFSYTTKFFKLFKKKLYTFLFWISIFAPHTHYRRFLFCV